MTDYNAIKNEIFNQIESMTQRNKTESHMLTYVFGIISGLRISKVLTDDELKTLKNEVTEQIYG